MALIELKQVSYRAGDQKSCKASPFAVEEGDYFTLTGPSGSGKSDFEADRGLDLT